MSATNTKSMSLFGFISVVDLGDATWIGGYLLLNPLGRPVEFHCTEPVKANRAQQILYGETLPAFICSEQIGRALVEEQSVEAHDDSHRPRSGSRSSKIFQASRWPGCRANLQNEFVRI